MNRYCMYTYVLVLLIQASICNAQHFTEFDLRPYYSSFPSNFQPHNNKLIFIATDSTGDKEPWVSDGTAQGTHVLKDINTGGLGSLATAFTKSNSQLYFLAYTPLIGQELYTTDGTETGTNLVKDIYPGNSASSISEMLAYSGKLYFFANDLTGRNPWMSDGTATGTQMLKSLSAFTAGVSNGSLFLVADDGVSGLEPWVSDGTPAGTKLLKDINISGGSLQTNNRPAFIAYKNMTFFAADDGINGYELWMTDGTTTGTVMLKNIRPTGSSYPSFVGVCNGLLFFYANDGTHGIELWATDGSVGGTQLVKDIYPGTSSGANSYTASMAYNNQLFFCGYDPTYGRELWVSDGTATGTHIIKDIVPGGGYSNPYGFFPYNGKLYFNATDATHGYELWVTDGTDTGTYMVKDLSVGSVSTYPYKMVEYHGKLYFAGQTAVKDWHMFVSDGTDAGTKLMEPPGTTILTPMDTTIFKGFTEYDNKLFFTAGFTLGGYELWSFQDTVILSVTNQQLNNQCTVYPNPASAKDIVHIQYRLPEAGNVSLNVINLYGQVVATLYKGNNVAGTHTINFAVSDYDLPSGMYLVQLVTQRGTATQKLTINR